MITVDRDTMTGALYVTLQAEEPERRAVRTERVHAAEVLLDYDAEGRLIGIELLGLP